MFQHLPHQHHSPTSQKLLMAHRPRFPAQQRPPYPSPFIVYLLGFEFCPVQTSVCFGGGSSLKPGGQIGNPPAHLVIVSNMHREWRQDGKTRRKAANVYFHCILDCVRRKQPFFPAKSMYCAAANSTLFHKEHKVYLAQKFGNLTTL